MPKLNKDQRRRRRKQKRTEYLRKSITRPDHAQKPRPWEAVKMKMISFPNPIPENVPKEVRLEVLRSIGGKAKIEFDEKYPKIRKWFEEYDAIYLLSFCAFYFGSHQEGIDLEATGSLDFYQHYLEHLQAFALYQDRTVSSIPLMERAKDLKEELKDIGKLMQLRLLDVPANLHSEQELEAYHLRIEMMSHTTAVRNWAYFHQMRKITLDLASKISERFNEKYKIDSVHFFETIYKVIDERNVILNEHLFKVRKIIKKEASFDEVMDLYESEFSHVVKTNNEEREYLKKKFDNNILYLKNVLISHADLSLDSVYSFDLKHFASLYSDISKEKELKILLDKLSISFGELAGSKIEYTILNNPVYHRPLIKVSEEKYFSAVFGSIPDSLLNILEDFICEDQDLKDKYSRDIKSKYLEDSLESLLRRSFPDASIYRGVEWKDSVDGKDYETDFLVIIESFVLIVEAKSGQITPSAKRGAPESLFQTLRELIEDPSEQANRFILFLSREKKLHTFSDKYGHSFTIDSTHFKHYIPLGVTLSHLGMISSNLKKLFNAGVTKKKIGDLALSMSLTDLECICELLPLQTEKVHYFARRREIEDHVNYEGDELDLLAFYLDNGFNIGDAEYSKDFSINLSLKSKELDPYFIGTNEGRKIVKPHLQKIDLWQDILDAIEKRKLKNWIETGYILLNSTKDDQKKFESAIKKLSKRVLAGKVYKPHNYAAFFSGPERRRYVIIGYPYINTAKEIRNGVMAEMIESDEIKGHRGVVILGYDLLKEDYPYTVLAGSLTTDLFDVLESSSE